MPASSARALRLRLEAGLTDDHISRSPGSVRMPAASAAELNLGEVLPARETLDLPGPPFTFWASITAAAVGAWVGELCPDVGEDGCCCEVLESPSSSGLSAAMPAHTSRSQYT